MDNNIEKRRVLHEMETIFGFFQTKLERLAEFDSMPESTGNSDLHDQITLLTEGVAKISPCLERSLRIVPRTRIQL